MAGETESSTEAVDGTGERSLGDALNPLRMSRVQQVGLCCLVLLGVWAPFAGVIGQRLLVLQLTGALFFATYVMCWDVVSGYTGEISFGHALFIGVGAYTSGILNVQLGLPLTVTIPLGVVAAALAGLIIGFPSLRLQGPYFSLITLVTPIILISVMRFAPDITGGETGLLGIEVLTFDPLPSYYIAFGVFLLGLVVFLAITRSDAGIVLTAIREDEVAVEAAGLNPAKFKLFAFVASGTVAGLAGSLALHSGHLGGVATPSDLLALVISIELIVAAILGGMGTITGAAVGGLAFYMARSLLRGVPVVGEFYFLVFAVLTLIFLFLVPEGIVPRVIRYVRSRGTERDPAVAADGGSTPLERALDRFANALRSLGGRGGER
jgi:branched-chain amino acid transport system permease protein